MMSATGNEPGQRGFTLIEIMITVSILALGTVMITQSNMMSLDVYGRYDNRLKIQNFAGEKIWEAKEKILESEFPEAEETAGDVSIRHRDYQWRLAVTAAEIKNLYQIRLDISWPEGRREGHLTRLTRIFKLPTPI